MIVIQQMSMLFLLLLTSSKGSVWVTCRFFLSLSFFQKLETDALQRMTTVLKRESTAGESFETIFDGAKSLVTGLANILRVSSNRARLYDKESLHESATSDSFIVPLDAQNLRKYPDDRNNGKHRASLLSDLLMKRLKRGAGDGESDTQLQVWFSIESCRDMTAIMRILKIRFSKQTISKLDLWQCRVTDSLSRIRLMLFSRPKTK